MDRARLNIKKKSTFCREEPIAKPKTLEVISLEALNNKFSTLNDVFNACEISDDEFSEN